MHKSGLSASGADGGSAADEHSVGGIDTSGRAAEEGQGRGLQN